MKLYEVHVSNMWDFVVHIYHIYAAHICIYAAHMCSTYAPHMTYTYYTCMTYIDKHVMYEIAYMWHICGVHGEHVWHVICYLYVAYMVHDDIYVTYDRVTCTTLYGVYICGMYVSHICDMCVAHMCDVEPAYTVFIYVTYMCHIRVTCAWHMCDT